MSGMSLLSHNKRENKMTNKDNKHTPEPWEVRTEVTDLSDETGEDQLTQYVIWPKNNYKNSMGFEVTQRVAICFNGLSERKDAKRIVACVNFCEGFSDKQLAEMGSLKEYCDWVKEQRLNILRISNQEGVEYLEVGGIKYYPKKDKK